MQENIEGVVITPMSIIDTGDGDVLHAMKVSDLGFNGFGEAYFSTIKPRAIKAWKRHREMTLNLVVPVGEIKFVLFDDRPKSRSYKEFQKVVISRSNNYIRLTVPPMVWMGFQGMDKNSSILLNIANIEHSANEADRQEINKIKFNWS